MTQLTDAQAKFIELSKSYEEIKNKLKDLTPELQSLMTEIGVGEMFQDPTDNTVFEITAPNGRFVHYEPIGYSRTNRADERRGGSNVVSKKKAQEAGFEV